MIIALYVVGGLLAIGMITPEAFLQMTDGDTCWVYAW
jgi:hypothetical protein